MKISIIVPIYNSEKYLHACVDSLINQTYLNIEIILVDDGSTDNSPSICDEYATIDSRVKVIHKVNGGVSSARNTGILASTGDYIFFVDADDWIETNACAVIAKKVKSGRSLYIWNLKKIRDGHIEILPAIQKKNSLCEMIADVIAAPPKQNAYLRAIGGKVYNKRILTDIVFPENLYIGEDACFLIQVFGKIADIEEIKTEEETWYNYRIHPESATKRFKPDLLEQSIVQYKYINDTIREMGFSDEKSIMTALTNFSWSIYFALMGNSMQNKCNSDDCHYWMELTKKDMCRADIDSGKLPKFCNLCWKLYGTVLNERQIEKIVLLYEKYKRNRHFQNRKK